MQRRTFTQLLGAASLVGSKNLFAQSNHDKLADELYGSKKFGNVHLMHFTDCHAQLMPLYYREPNVNLGVGSQAGQLPHLTGEALLKACRIAPGTAQAHAFTHLHFQEEAKRFGKIGGFAHLATLIKRLRADRPNALLLDGGDTWQGSATALWSKGQDMVEACKRLGVDVMTGHFEFTYGDKRVQEIINNDLKGKIEFLGQNVATADFGDPVFKPYVIRELNGVAVAIIGQCFPYTPIANPRYLVPEWRFGIQEENLQKNIDDAKSKGAQVVVLLSHNGMDVDLKLATRVRGLHAILGGHTHDGVPQAVKVKNAGGETWVTNAGSHGKYLATLDLEVKNGRVMDMRYQLLPVFSNLLKADVDMQAHIDKVRAPYLAKLNEPLATVDNLLYRRGNFNGTWDQLLCEALMAEKNAQISFSPGFRWGNTLLPGDTLRFEDLMSHTAITYPYTTVSHMSGAFIKTILEDVADNIFHLDPYYQQGGDMVRVGGMNYSLAINEAAGKRISNMRLNTGELIEADKHYKVAGWAPVADSAEAKAGEPIWDLAARYLKNKSNPANAPARPLVPLVPLVPTAAAPHLL
ncbi:MAG: hypothetical protein RLZZ502_1584 [Pseudomonadota bacterium]|jgi:sulfur-oxidizing protein SoxB